MKRISGQDEGGRNRVFQGRISESEKDRRRMFFLHMKQALDSAERGFVEDTVLLLDRARRLAGEVDEGFFGRIERRAKIKGAIRHLEHGVRILNQHPTKVNVHLKAVEFILLSGSLARESGTDVTMQARSIVNAIESLDHAIERMAFDNLMKRFGKGGSEPALE